MPTHMPTLVGWQSHTIKTTVSTEELDVFSSTHSIILRNALNNAELLQQRVEELEKQLEKDAQQWASTTAGIERAEREQKAKDAREASLDFSL